MSQPLDEAWVRQRVPPLLLDAVSVQRQVCRFYNTKHGCKKGNGCTNLHCKPHERPEDAKNAWRLPHISRFGDQLRIRPPLHNALLCLFQEKQRPMVLGTGRVIVSTDNTSLYQQAWLIHELRHMAVHDAVASP